MADDLMPMLRQIAVRRTFENERTIHTQGDGVRFLDVVVAGHVRLSYMVEDGSSVLHTVLPAGQSFGEVGVLAPFCHVDTAVAAGPVALMSFPVAALFDLAIREPDLSRSLRAAAAARGRDTMAMVRALSLQSLTARLARVLARVADQIGTPVERDGDVVLRIAAVVSQGDLAIMARGSRGNVNKVLGAWQRAGWIALENRSIVVLDRAALADLVRQGDG